jgi:hypothetical protein
MRVGYFIFVVPTAKIGLKRSLKNTIRFLKAVKGINQVCGIKIEVTVLVLRNYGFL